MERPIDKHAELHRFTSRHAELYVARRALQYWFSKEHLEGSKHARDHYRKHGGFLIEELLRWPQMNGFNIRYLWTIVDQHEDLSYRESEEIPTNDSPLVGN